MTPYIPSKWYWLVGSDTTQVYSSAAKSYVPVSDAGYVAWAAAGGYATRIADEDELAAVFAAQYPAGWYANPRYVPVYLARQRLEAAGKWEAAATAIASDPAMMLKVLTLESGLDVADPQVLAVLSAIGADPAVILA